MSLMGSIKAMRQRLESYGCPPTRIVMGWGFHTKLADEVASPVGVRIATIDGLPVEISEECPTDSCYLLTEVSA